MQENQPNQTIDSPSLIPSEKEIPKEPVIETENLTTELPAEEIIAEVRKTDPPTEPEKELPKEVAQAVRPEMDFRLSHANRIVAFLEGRKTGEFIRLNDFLKSLWPITKPNMPSAFTNPDNMRFLRITLKQLQEDRKVIFANNSFERLGKHYYDGADSEQKTKYHNVLTVPIEAKISQ